MESFEVKKISSIYLNTKGKEIEINFTKKKITVHIIHLNFVDVPLIFVPNAT